MQCELKSQLAYIYICAQLPSRLGMQLNLRLHSLYVLLLCLYVPSRLGMQLNLRLHSLYVLLLCLYVLSVCYYYICNGTLPAPGTTRGTKHMFKMES